jgi:Tfp pilus assembly protein PilX
MTQQERHPGQRLGDEKGLVLVVSLMMVAVIILLGTTAVMTTSTDLKISANYRTGSQAFYVAEAGIEEARRRLKIDDPASAFAIPDSHPTQTGWAAYIGAEAKATGKGYNSGNSMMSRYATIQPSSPTPLDYTVKIVHATNAAGNLLYWYDSDGNGLSDRNTTPSPNRNIYRITGYGAAGNATQVIEVEIARRPPINVPGALYVEAPTNIIGNAHVLGVDQCGGASKPGITTTLAASTVDCSNNSEVTGSDSPTGDPPSVAANAPNMDVEAMIDQMKGSANYSYHISGTQTGMNWGTPTPGATLQNPSSCSVKNVVYYDTRDGSGNPTELKLAGGTQGCGILIIDGDLDINGGFSWYGVVLVRGSVKYTGGGNKNVTGGMVTGGSVIADVVGGNANIVYCSSAVNNQTANAPLQRLSWKENI